MTVGALCPIARYPNCDTKRERHKVSQYLCERAIGHKIIESVPSVAMEGKRCVLQIQFTRENSIPCT